MPPPGSCVEGPCVAAQEAPRSVIFQGASEDGSRVFFTTHQPLLDEDKDEGNDLYMATLGCSVGLGEICSGQQEVTSLVRLSKDSHPGESADVENNVVALSPEGASVYFVARGDLLEKVAQEELEVANKPVPHHGADNLYVVDTATDREIFVTSLCSGPSRSGVVADESCPADLDEETSRGARNDTGLWIPTRVDHEGQTTQDGRYLVFASYRKIIAVGSERDSDIARDIYVFDKSTDMLQRVSVGQEGFDANGNNDQFNASVRPTFFEGTLPDQYELGGRSVTNDGSMVVFSTMEPLSPQSTNHRQDVYAWRNGDVHLISSGSAIEDDAAMAISPEGRDIFLATSADLVATDTDGLVDIYDARIGGGFPPKPASTEPCSGDACQGPLTAPIPVLFPASVLQPAGGNFHKVVKKAKVKRKAKRRPLSQRRRRAGHHAHNKLARATGKGSGR
jgi:hypothetical protein